MDAINKQLLAAHWEEVGIETVLSDAEDFLVDNVGNYIDPMEAAEVLIVQAARLEELERDYQECCEEHAELDGVMGKIFEIASQALLDADNGNKHALMTALKQVCDLAGETTV